MIPLSIASSDGGERSFLVEFKHRKRNGKWPELYAHSPLNGVTTCAILGHMDQNGTAGNHFVALGSAICVRADNFSRRFGRYHAFQDAVQKCGLLRPVAALLDEAYKRRWPDPQPEPPKPKVAPTAEQIEQYRAAARSRTQIEQHRQIEQAASQVARHPGVPHAEAQTQLPAKLPVD